MKYGVETMPCAFSSPTGVSTSVLDAPDVVQDVQRLPADFATAAIAWAENFGVVMLRNVSAPEPASFDICEATVGSVTS